MNMPLIPRSLIGQRDIGFQALLDGIAGLEPFAGQVAFPVDIEENDDAFVLRVDVPGVAPDQINLETKDTRAGQVLTLMINKGLSRDSDRGTIHRQERVSVQGCRAFVLPKGVDADQINAKQQHGVLTITLPRRHPIQPGSRKIAIQTDRSEATTHEASSAPSNESSNATAGSSAN